MFHLYQHHDLEALAALLAALRERAAPASMLAPDTIVVPNRGTARWLQAQLAAAEGVAANLALPLPAPFVWRVLRDTLPGEADSSEYTRERLGWHLYAVLPAVAVPQVQRYLAPEPRERQRYQLAMRLADVFDAYLVHRRDVLAQWEAGEVSAEPPAAWQAPVWQALVQRLGPRHRARLLAELLERAQAGRLDTSRLPATVYAFALADLPVDYLRLLHALGRYIEVHFLLPNPSAGYWGDLQRRPVARVDGGGAGSVHEAAPDPAFGARRPAAAAMASAGPAGAPPAPGPGATGDGHPLLASLGRAGRDFLRVLYADELAAIDEPDLGAALAPAPPGEACLLHRVQSGLIAGEPGVSGAGMAAEDVSIQVHACPGPLREMQVLHDRLLDLLARWPDLEPRGILVLLPDVARYAPAVHSVFGAAEGERAIPYSVADRPRRDLHPIAQTFQQLVELPLARWTASEVLALAGVPAVRRRFELDEGDLELLHQWVAAAGVRWGLDRESRRAAGAADFEQNTWVFGLDRLLLGLAQREEDILIDGVAPWSDLEGASGAAVGRLWLLLERLRFWRERMAEPADAATWHERLNAMAGELFAADPDDPDESAALDTVHEAAAVLEGAAAALGPAPLAWEAVREALRGAFAGSRQRQPMVTGGVTFAGLEPLRGVPFEVICMAGMDDGVFPRQDGQRELSLLHKHPRTGDPSVRDADRMTFLQALASARRCFYLSYTGRNLQDGEALQPSPVVGELLDFLHGHYFTGADRAACRRRLVTEQPLHPFSPRYFEADSHSGGGRLFTFVAHWRRAAEAQRGPRQDPVPFLDATELEAPEPAEPIALADVQRFFRHPARWFFRERLRLPLDDAETRLEDEEPRALDALARHLLRERLFARACAAGAAAVATEPDALERARGALPPPPLGSTGYAPAAADVNALLGLHWQWAASPDGESDREIELALAGGARLIGRIAGAGETQLRRLRPGPLRLHSEMPWWLEYLALAASGHAVGLSLAGVTEGQVQHKQARLEPAEARRLLEAAIAVFQQGCRRPLLFEPYLADAFLEKRASKTPAEALDSINGWLSNRRYPPHPVNDDWLQPLFEPFPQPLGRSPAESPLVQITEAVARPLREHLRVPDAAP